MPLTNGEACYWRMVKSASTTVTGLLARERWVTWGADHVPCSVLLSSNEVRLRDGTLRSPRDIPIHFGTVRRPEDWYGSVWQHTLGRERLSRSREAFTVKYEDFKGFLYGCTHREELGRVLEFPLAILHPLPGAQLQEGVGLWSAAMDYFFRAEGEWLVDFLLPSDRLQEGLLEAFGIEKEVSLTNTAQKRLDLRTGYLGAPRKTDYQIWYDDEMLKWVRAADYDLLKVFSFKPFTLSPLAVHRFPTAPTSREKVSSS